MNILTTKNKFFYTSLHHSSSINQLLFHGATSSSHIHARAHAHTPSRPIKAVAPRFNSSRPIHDWQLLAEWRRWQCLRPSTLTYPLSRQHKN